jgi:Ser/Thr protein kinase RdoA (MazF antagonist)
VRRLRRLGLNALAAFPVSAASVHFLNHGENTTFRVETRDGSRYLLRVHRPGYHTRAAIAEEMRWLEHLGGATGMTVPAPVRSRRGRWVEAASASGVPGSRLSTLMRFVAGWFSRTRLTLAQVFALGRAAAELHSRPNQIRIVHRRYWSADGLVGPEPKLGSIEDLASLGDRNRRILREARNVVYRALGRFERRFPERTGLIHADLHFGNVLFERERVALIDFDDCGSGPYGYDLAAPLISLAYRAKRKTIRSFDACRDALLAGYASGAPWDRDSERILPYLIAARKLAMLGWMQSRSDHPRLKAYLQKAIPETVRDLGVDLGIR